MFVSTLFLDSLIERPTDYNLSAINCIPTKNTLLFIFIERNYKLIMKYNVHLHVVI